jgi:ribosome biogenesis GTPase / thiamine phosphate phosphatase
MSKNKKVRVELRKNRTKPPRENDLTRDYSETDPASDDQQSGERVRAKGDISRHRTVMLEAGEAEGMPAINEAECLTGRVFRVHGLFSMVEVEDGRVFRCSVRRLLKSLVTDERSIVTTGDRVWIRPAVEAAPTDLPEGTIERVEPRHGVLTRASRRREHVLVANVDQLVIVMSLVQPDLKPHLIDRYIAAAIKGKLKPVLCLNKADLTDAVSLQPLIGAYAQMGIPTMLTSAKTGRGIPELREQLAGRATVFSGQSGVGKSSLLNAIQPELSLRVKTVSESNDKGRHTTTTAELIRLEFGGWVVDTPGVRQLQLWDTRPEEVEGYLPDFMPYVPLCNFPDCTHIHESGCAILRAVSRQHLSDRRYQSYLGLFHGMTEE